MTNTATGRHESPTAGEMEGAIHALHAIITALLLILNEQQPALDEAREREHRDGLLIAARQITEDMRRRF